MTLEGSITALVTPFQDGRFDRDSFESIVDWQIREGVHGLVPCGTTGESPTLSEDEHHHVVESCIAAAAGRVPVIAGCGTNATDSTIARLRHAEGAGADAALVVTPYYNKPSQEGLLRHFRALHESCDLPIVIYNIPGRSAVDMTVETMSRLSDLERIIGVKDATGDLARVALQRRACGEDFIQLSGEDATALGFNAMGGRGCISVTANVAPKLCADFHAACQRSDFATALGLQDRLIALHRAMFCEPSPAPAKYALSLLGKCLPDLRLPLAPLSEAGRATVAAAMAEAGLEPARESA